MSKLFIKDGKAYVTDERWVTIGGEDNDGSGQHVLIKENGTITAGFGTGKNVRNAFGGESKRKADTPQKANEAVKGEKRMESAERKSALDKLDVLQRTFAGRDIDAFAEKYYPNAESLDEIPTEGLNKLLNNLKEKYTRAYKRHGDDGDIPAEAFKMFGLEKPKKDTQIKVEKFKGAPTIEELKEKLKTARYHPRMRIREALREKEYLTQGGKKDLKNAHFRKTSEENAAFRKEHDKEYAKVEKKKDAVRAEIDKLNAEYRTDKGRPDSPEFEREKEYNYRVAYKKLRKKLDSINNAWNRKEDDIYEKHGQYGGRRYAREEVEGMARETLKRFRNRKDSK